MKLAQMQEENAKLLHTLKMKRSTKLQARPAQATAEIHRGEEPRPPRSANIRLNEREEQAVRDSSGTTSGSGEYALTEKINIIRRELRAERLGEIADPLVGTAKNKV